MPKNRYPQENPNYKRPACGPRKIVYEEDKAKRRKRRSTLRKSVMRAASRLAIICGAQVLVKVVDENRQSYTYATDELWNTYLSSGLFPDLGEKRCDDKGYVPRAAIGSLKGISSKSSVCVTYDVSTDCQSNRVRTSAESTHVINPVFDCVRMKLSNEFTQHLNAVEKNDQEKFLQQWVAQGSLASDVRAENDSWLSTKSWDTAQQLHKLLTLAYHGIPVLKLEDKDQEFLDDGFKKSPARGKINQKKNIKVSLSPPEGISNRNIINIDDVGQDTASASDGAVSDDGTDAFSDSDTALVSDEEDVSFLEVNDISLQNKRLDKHKEKTSTDSQITIKKEIELVSDSDLVRALSAQGMANPGITYKIPVVVLDKLITVKSEKGESVCGNMLFDNESVADSSAVGLSEYGKACSEEKELSNSQKVLNSRNYDCSVCGKQFNLKGTRDRHLEKIHQQLKCKKCKQFFESQAEHDRHLVSCPSLVFRCDICQMVCSAKKSLIKHVERCRKKELDKRDGPAHILIDDQNLANCFVEKLPEIVDGQRRKAASEEKEPFSCVLCAKKFPNAALLYKHARTHIFQQFECEVCGKKFKNKGLRDRHLMYVHKVPRCKKCKQFFKSQSDVAAHTCPSLIFKCDVCDLVFRYRDTLRKHTERKHGEYDLPCEICGKILKKNNLISHLKRMHSIFNCTTRNCKFTCDNLEAFLKHTADVHKKQFSEKVIKRTTKKIRVKKGINQAGFMCEHCGKSLKQKSELKKHIQNIHVEEEHKCDTCQKVFVSKFKLHIHMKLVHGGVSNMCSRCQIPFPTKRSLAKHMDAMHNEVSSMNTAHCETCGKSFINERNLRRHIQRNHVPSNRHSCPHCTKNYNSQSALKEHIKIEHQGFRYKCEHCTMTFKHKSKLKEHEIAKHTSLKPLGCEECGEFFARRSRLEYHTEKVHGHKLHSGYDGMYNLEIAQHNWITRANRVTTDAKGQPLKAHTAIPEPVSSEMLERERKVTPRKARKRNCQNYVHGLKEESDLSDPYTAGNLDPSVETEYVL